LEWISLHRRRFCEYKVVNDAGVVRGGSFVGSGLPRNQKAPGRPSLSRRALLLVVLFVIIVIVVVFFVLRSSGSSTAKPDATVPPSVSHTALPRPTSTLTAQQLKIRKQDAALVSYARPVAPILSNSARLFDQALGAASAASLKKNGLTDLVNACDKYAPKIQVQSAQFEGITHGFAAKSLASRLYESAHHSYSDDLAALNNCSAASDSKDPNAAASAIAELRQSAREMHGLDRYAHALLQP